MAVYKAFTQTAELTNLSEGDIINAKAYIERLELFAKLGVNGTYITDATYKKFSNKGYHYYKLETLIKYFSQFGDNNIVIRYSNKNKLACQLVK